MTRPPPTTDPGLERRAALRLWFLVAIFASVAAVRSAYVGVPFRDPGGEFLLHRVAITASVLVVLVALDGWRRTPRSGRAPAAVLLTVRRRWTRQRLGLAVAGLAAYHATYFCYHNLKSWNAFRTVHDDLLGGVDRTLFLGRDPAVLLHSLLGEHVATWLLLGVYESFATLVSVSFVAAVVWPERLMDGLVLLASMVWAWILGVASYYAIPSIGPFHSAPGDFAGLPHSVVTTTQAHYLAQRADLLADPGASGAFAQLAAFASLHVAMSTVIWLSVRARGPWWLSRVLGVFAAVTAVATVFLGWHFAVDDVAGLLIAVAAVRLGRSTVLPARR